MVTRLTRRQTLALGAALALSTGWSRASSPQPIRRGYVPFPAGQLHYRIARPGIDAGTRPVICLHDCPFSGRIYEPLLPILAEDRTVMAPDLPGYGDSDPTPAAPDIAGYAGATMSLLDQLLPGLSVDLVGYEVGAIVAIQLALMAPARVRRLVLIDLPSEKDPPRAVRLEVVPAGLHLQAIWDRYAAADADWVSLERAQYFLADAARRPGISHWGHQAAARFPTNDKLATLRHPATVLDLRDRRWTRGFIDRYPAETARLLRSLLDREAVV